LFIPIALKERIFRRNESPVVRHHLDFPAVFVPSQVNRLEASLPERRPGATLQTLAEQLVYARFAPPAVLVDEQGDIVFFSGRTGQYLEPAAGKANLNVMAMAREGLRYDLSNALQKAHRKKDTVTVREIKVGAGDAARSVDLVVQPLDEPKELRGMFLIVFSETVIPAETSVRGSSKKTRSIRAPQRELEQQLLRAREGAQAAREEMQSSQEELKSMNEEMQSTNEELQSTNEELTTSKEEMQSLNEELQTVNTELQTKLDELSGANSDMKNLLNSTDIATVFLDNDLRLRRFTLQAKTIVKFIPSDVGRPFTDLASALIYPALVTDAHEVLRTLVFSERSITTGDGRWFTVRIMPYRTMDNRIDGVVITFADITAAKKVEAGLREKNTDLNTHSAEQGRALDRAEERLEAHDAREQLREAKDKPNPKVVRAPEKPKR
jgi:two-component system CheB/CheR fusion protein